MRPKIAITAGDINGIGPEVALKSMIKKNVLSKAQPFIIAPVKIIKTYCELLNLKFHIMENEDDFLPEKDVINVLPMKKFENFEINIGKPTKTSGKIAGESIILAVELCLQKKADAICTSPVSKKALDLAGFNYPGQTEMIAKLSNSKRFLMMFVNNQIKLGLATIHIPISKVSKILSEKLLSEKIKILIDSLRFDFAIKSPTIAVLGLNPHAGEDGLIGNEEQNIIKPVITQLGKEKITIEGTFPADGFFGKRKYKNYDAVLSLYHDQGLIPIKLIDFYRTVNFSAGLNIIRTSPNHGTAYDIAGKLIANEKSMESAIILSAQIFKNRAKSQK